MCARAGVACSVCSLGGLTEFSPGPRHISIYLDPQFRNTGRFAPRKPQSVDKETKRVSQAGSRRLGGESVPKQLRTALFGRGGVRFYELAEPVGS